MTIATVLPDEPRPSSLRETSVEREALHRLRLELTSAGAVQSRLLATEGPRMATIRYAASSIAARGVGGDYYDFLGASPGRLGVGIGDVSGKGISAAILMASLQAHVRSRYPAVRDLRDLMEAVNRELARSTEDSRFATLFLGDYEDRTRVLRYVSAGQSAGFLLRADGAHRLLGSTGTVLGILPDWNGAIEETILAAGDTLLLFTDGITEATDEWGEPFGERRLLTALRLWRHLRPDHICRTLQQAVRRFSPGERSDDRTLVVLQGTPRIPGPS